LYVDYNNNDAFIITIIIYETNYYMMSSVAYISLSSQSSKGKGSPQWTPIGPLHSRKVQIGH
jgi:hypothetical protein